MSHCSEITSCKLVIQIKCVHCNVTNYVSQEMDNDPSKLDIAEITCWGCGKQSLIDELLLDMYPEYPDESTGACFEGKPSLDYT